MYHGFGMGNKWSLLWEIFEVMSSVMRDKGVLCLGTFDELSGKVQRAASREVPGSRDIVYTASSLGSWLE